MNSQTGTSTPSSIDKYYGVDYLAELFGVTPWTIREWLKAGMLKGIKVGQQWKVSDSDLKTFLKERHG